MNTAKQTQAFFKLFYMALSVIVITLSAAAFAKGGVNANSNNLAIEGYDPVAYFVSSEAQEGKLEFTHVHQDNKWQFANEKNKQAFIANPTAYLPQYGGYCAFAASKNQIAPIDPRAWTIHNGKLYLNYSISVREMWRTSIDENIAAADKNWPELIKTVQ